MDAITYFLSHLLIQNIILSIVSFLLGLWLGAIIWGRFREKFARSEARLTDSQAALERLEDEAKQHKHALEKQKKKTAELKKQLKKLNSEPMKPESLANKDVIAPQNNDDDWGFLPPEEAATKDDLTKIQGITPEIEKKLRSRDVTTFQQIIDWKPEALTEFTIFLNLPDQASLEAWQKEATKLKQ